MRSAADAADRVDWKYARSSHTLTPARRAGEAVQACAPTINPAPVPPEPQA
jgi:hypothetical protein